MCTDGEILPRQIRAHFDDETIVVYQAYGSQIAGPAVRAGTFVAPFGRGRMTWIKPSFLWMMYRSGWGTKQGQERVLAARMCRDGFEWALGHACLSSYEPGTYASREAWAERKAISPVRVQWDPDRSVTLERVERRAIQVGLQGEAVRRYVDEWMVGLDDVTDLAHDVHHLVGAGDPEAAMTLLPVERPYPVPTELQAIIGSG